MLTLFSCKKNQNTEIIPLNINEVTLKEAHTEYQRAITLGLPKTINGNSISPNWNQISRYSISEDDNNLYVTLGANIKTKVLVQLVVRKKKGVIYSYIVEARPNLRQFNSERLDYSKLYGKMLFYDLTGRVRGIIKLENGLPVRKELLAGTGSNSVMSTNNPFGDADNDGVINLEDECPNTPTNVMVDPKGCPIVNDLDEVNISPDHTWPLLPPINLGGFQFPPMDSNPGPGGPSGGDPGSSAPSYIINEVTDSCINRAVGTALSANENLVGIMAGIIRNLDNSKTVQVKIKDGETSHGTPGECASITKNGQVVRIEITIQTMYFSGPNGASKESLIGTLIHEVVHGYIRQIDPSQLEAHHDIIAAKYIDPMAVYLQTYFGISSVDAYALSWSGVPDSKVFREATNATMFPLGPGGTSVPKSDLIYRAASYNSRSEYLDEGKKGQDICN